MVTLVSRPSFSLVWEATRAPASSAFVFSYQGAHVSRFCFFVSGFTAACSAQVWNSEPLQVKMSMRFLRSGGCREVRAAAAAAA